MPGVKRKAGSSSTTNGAGPSSSANKSKAKPLPKSSRKPSLPSEGSGSDDSEDGDDDDMNDEEDFDDDQDLLADAQDGSYESDDESMEGGFEDLEDGVSDEDSEADTDGFEDLEGQDQDQEDQQASQSKRSKNSHLYAPPTNEEMQGLRETGDLFKTNIFKLQIEEMLENIRPASHCQAPLDRTLRSLHQLFASIKSIAPLSVDEASRAIQKSYPSLGSVHIPFANPQPSNSNTYYKLAFEPPTNMQIVGSWPLKLATLRPEGFDVDLAVVMPSSLFQEKDHLNMRYFHKRAFYLAVLAAAIQSSAKELGVDVAYELSGQDSKKPILVLRPINDKSEKDFTKLKAGIRIHLTHEVGIFPVGRLAPSRNNFRTSSDETTQQAPTPRYNSAILADSLQTPHMVYLHATAKACPAFADACALLKVWSFQRGFGSGTATKAVRRTVLGTDNARFVLTMILAHLLHGQATNSSSRGLDLLASRAKLSNSFSAYQLFRGVIEWIANHPFNEQPVLMKPAASAGIPSFHDKIDQQDFARPNFPYAIVDPSGSLNLLATWLPGSMDLLQREARQTAAMLDDADTDHFDAIFLTQRTSPLSIFDDCARFSVDKHQGVDKLAKIDFGNEQHSNGAAVVEILQQGLTGRASFNTLLALSPSREARSQPITGSQPSSSKRKSSAMDVELGIVYDGPLAFRSVEHGPPPESKEEANAFQQFWGDVAELRRFKDGRILYSIVWEIAGQNERWTIPRRIVRHLLQRHGLPSAASKITFQSEAFDNLTEIPREVAERAYLAVPEEKGFQLVQSAFDNLARQLRSMDDLPLSLISITPNGAGLRGTSTMVPPPVNLGALGTSIPDGASYIPAQEIVLTFESSGRWPDELKSIQAMKIAFLERLATLLPNKLPGIEAHVALDEDAEESEIQDQASLEIILPSGFAFRARIHHERERMLLERVISDKRDTPLAERQEASRALERFTSRFVTGPAHHAAIAACVHRFGSLGETIRLLKRWISSQMMDGHVSEQLIELLACSVFLSSGTCNPSTGPAGFVQVLQRLATWNWKEEPILLPLQSVVRASDDTSLKTIRFPTDARLTSMESFKTHRKTDPSLSSKAWFLATEEDLHADHWGGYGPSGAIAHSIQELAKGVVKYLSLQDKLTPQTVRGLFTPSFKPYHFIIHLKSGVSPRYVESLDLDPETYLGKNKSGFKNQQSKISSSLYGSLPRIAFDTIESYVRLLKSIYGDSLRLHYNLQGQVKIGALFNPSLAVQSRKFKVGSGFNSRPNSDDGAEVKLNSKAVLTEIERLGEGLVDKVEVLQSFD
ncbi:unnamed protein product [Sympodiomycopsis kandeliae]